MNRHLAATENQTTAIQYLWDTGKAILRGKFKNYKPISKKKKKTWISSNKNLHIKEVEKKKSPKRVQEGIIKIRVERNPIDSKK